ncbi:phage conserved hypothetical protein BR0599 [Cohaesibacter marisflavi]|uniref:Bacteriophage phiJL001 Gp84 C-terminal domain-containing protein n=1 Tax=Cohaesibacter marisflavi TaxID=655353 RepID=A0A1I5A4B1_9HYPH|nr:DUF2163 domain-containing protein [Cohaesibacter marisflavi]SFN57381.1 phage conserved hypothetical protein BR0599 [Cohaesibacter marisflavi]
MKVLSDEMKAHLQSGTTTLATCWILRRVDGFCLGFTDHDRTIELNGVSCEPDTGFTGSEIRQSDGFASDDQDISGVLTSDRITEADLMSGRYDAATIETWCVNWQSTDQCLLLRTGYLGEIKRDRQSFQAEIRSLSIDMEQEKGRVFQYRCDANVGDARCGLKLDALGLTFKGVVSGIKSQNWLVVTLETRPEAGRLSMGRLEMTSGAASGMAFDIISHQQLSESEELELWLPLHEQIAPGDGVKVSVGCDKSFSTCRKLFANQLNFRGFPHMPGNDFILTYPSLSQQSDGSPLIED